MRINDKFTKGPWIAKYHRHLFPRVQIGRCGNAPDYLIINAGGGPDAEHNANAALIAASPTNYSALHGLILAAERYQHAPTPLAHAALMRALRVAHDAMEASCPPEPPQSLPPTPPVATVGPRGPRRPRQKKGAAVAAPVDAADAAGAATAGVPHHPV